MRNIIKTTLIAVPLAVAVLTTGCERINPFSDECTVDSEYKIKCEPNDPPDGPYFE